MKSLFLVVAFLVGLGLAWLFHGLFGVNIARLAAAAFIPLCTYNLKQPEANHDVTRH